MRLRFILPLLIALLCPTFALGAFTEFYCNASTGSNMNGGSDENTSPSYTATNGGWNSGTGVFTPTSGDPSASGVSVGQFAHVFADGGTTPTFIGRVTAVSSTTVTVSTTAKSGTAPGTSGTGISINVGGCWKGPNGTVNFPFGFITNAAKDASGNWPRVNLKNNATYAVSAAITHNNAGPTQFEGYTTTPGDEGKFILDGQNNNITLLTLSAEGLNLASAELKNTAAGAAVLCVVSGADCNVYKSIFHHANGFGLNVSGGAIHVVECEAYDTCLNQNGGGGFDSSGGANRDVRFIRCYSHDNASSGGPGVNGACGFRFTDAIFIDCIADSNNGGGFLAQSTTRNHTLLGCDSYNNGYDGFTSERNGAGVIVGFHIENCNFVKNGGYGINCTGTSDSRMGRIVNCGFGSGTQANTSGQTNNIQAAEALGSITYASNVTPWNDPANGDFTITLAAAKGAGRGTFATGLTSTVGYPDIGAAQHQDSGGGGVSRARVVNPRD